MERYTSPVILPYRRGETDAPVELDKIADVMLNHHLKSGAKKAKRQQKRKAKNLTKRSHPKS